MLIPKRITSDRRWRGEEEEGERKTRFRSDRMPLFEHVNFFDGPSVEAVRVVALEISNVARMIVWRVWLSRRWLSS